MEFRSLINRTKVLFADTAAGGIDTVDLNIRTAGDLGTSTVFVLTFEKT